MELGRTAPPAVDAWLQPGSAHSSLSLGSVDTGLGPFIYTLAFPHGQSDPAREPLILPTSVSPGSFSLSAWPHRSCHLPATGMRGQWLKRLLNA